MINIEITNDIITISGHAGFAKKGEDIVCAAISTLTQNFIYSVECLTNDKIKYYINDGLTVIKIKNLTEAKLLLSSFLYGCRMIADNFPDFVQVSEH